MKFSSIFSFLWIMGSLSVAQAQVTNIPDPNFEQALIDLGIDTNTTLDGQVPTADIDTIEQLDVSGRNISDLTGIEDFVNLTSLNCASNRIVTLDLSVNTGLTSLICSSNQLAALDVSANVNLTSLLCSSNSLAVLDIVQNTALVLLDCSGNMLVNLDLSENRLLENLNCSDNKLTVLEVGQNDSLRSMTCSKNRLTQLDVSDNERLQSLVCTSNQLSEIDVSANLLLTTLDYSSNFVRSHDLSANTALTSLNCSDNLLGYLAINNGNNEALSSFDARNNPFLSCITVDDAAETGAQWTKDGSASYAETCDPIRTFVPDDNFEQALIDMGLDTGPLDDYVVTDSIRLLTVLDVSGENIADLTGIEDFLGLITLDCSDNQLAILDFTKNTALTSLNCSSNDLTVLNLKNNNNIALANMDARTNPTLTCIAIDNGFVPGGGWQKDAGADYEFNCNPGQTFVPDDNFEQALIDLGLDAGPLDNYVPTANINAITSLDVSGKYIADLTGIEDFVALESLDCSENRLASLDVSNNVSLTELRTFSNYLSELDVMANIALVSLHCGNNLLDGLDVTQNPDLEELIFDSNFLTGIDMSNKANLVRLNANSNKITDAGLDLSDAVNLERLLCSNNKLSTLDVSQNTALINLNCSANKLNGLDLSENEDIEKIDCSQNFLTDLDLSDNPELDTLNCSSNRLISIDLNSNLQLRMLVISNNSLDTIDVSDNEELRFFNIASNNLTNLTVNDNQELIFLNCNGNNLNNLNVTNNGDLSYLACADNNLTEINITQNTALVTFIADENDLTELDTEANTVLEELSVANNQLTSLDFEANTALSLLNCNGNNLTELDLESNIDLAELRCSGNDITELDLSLHPQLTTLNGQSNNLTRLNVRNGANATLETFNVVGNPSLFCIEVDDPLNTGSEWQKDAQTSYNDNCHYDETYVPDDNFESALAAITGEPDNNDNYILTSAISALTSLDVNNQGISDLTGIQDFVALQTLNVSNNSIDSIYLGNNSELQHFNGSFNAFADLDLSENVLLETLDAADNALTTLQLDSLTALTSLSCQSNDLVELNLTHHTGLVSLNCANNALEFLRVNNGNNANLSTFDATNNLDLFCIQVDSEAVVGALWLKDEVASYSANCHYNETAIPDPAFEQALIDFGYDYSVSGPLDGYVPTATIRQVSILSVRGRDIVDLTGIEDFEALTSLDCSNNLLTAVDLSQNTSLRILNASDNQLTALEISSNLGLVDLEVSRNSLTEIDVSQNADLVRLDVSTNQLTSLDIVPNTDLREVTARSNNLFTVIANNGYNDTLEVFDLRNNQYLTCILIDNIANAQSYPGWSKDAHSFYQLVCEDDDNDGVPNDEDLCPNTLPGVQVDLFGCPIFSLPANNFTILTTSESCRTGNNGKINITASQVHPFVATLTGSIDTTDYEFFDKVEIRNVRADTYRLCIRVIGQEGFEHCYTVVITEPDYLRVAPSAAPVNGRVAYQLSGGEAYIVAINGLEFTTTNENISLDLVQGRNDIRIRTEAECQGVFEETIYLSERATLFPNPFNDQLRVVMDPNLTEEVQIQLYVPSGKLIKSAAYLLKNGQLEIDTSELAVGMYIIEVRGEHFQSKFKAIKK